MNNEVHSQKDAGQRSAARERAVGKFLTFFLSNEEYGIEILKVREIIGLLPITPVPRTPQSIKGVINLRGQVIPVMDIRFRFGMAEVKTTELTCIIVVQTRDSEVGIIVDGVSEVVDVTSENLVETPSFGAQVTTEYIIGIYKEEDGVTILLDIDKVISELQEVPEDEKTRRIQCLDS